MIDIEQFRELIIKPTLEHLNMYSPEAEDLIVGTGLVESGFKAIKQYGGGPALGFFQMEPATHDDIWGNYIMYRESLAAKMSLLVRHPMVSIQEKETRDPEEMVWNLKYAVAMCRIHYYRVPAPVPKGNIQYMGNYWKTYYNTALGKGNREKYVEAWERKYPV